LKFNKLKNREISEFIENKIDILKLDDEDFSNMHKFYRGSSEVKFIDTGIDLKKTLIVYNCYKDVSKPFLKDASVRKFLSGIIHDSLMRSKLNNDKSLIRKIIYDEKMLRKNGIIANNKEGILLYKNNIKFKIKILCPEEDITLKEIAQIAGEALSHKGIEVNIDIEPFNLFLEKIFNSYDYDIAFINYKFDRGILSYYNLYGTDKFSFYPFLFDDNKTADYVANIMEGAINSLSFQKADEKIDKLCNYFYNNYQLYPVYETKVFYLIKKNIYNLKINARAENRFDLKTIERLIKVSD